MDCSGQDQRLADGLGAIPRISGQVGSKGLAYLVHKEFLSWQEIEKSIDHCSDMREIISSARQDYEKLHLEQQTPHAHMKNSPLIRL